MSLELEQQQSESPEGILNTLLHEERVHIIDPTELRMYDAENAACFYFFSTHMEKLYGKDWFEEVSPTHADMSVLLHEFITFREEIESTLKNTSSKTYDAYLLAIADGDGDTARRILMSEASKIYGEEFDEEE